MRRAVGIDSHKDTLAACVIDEIGRPMGYRSFENTAGGHDEALAWVRELDVDRVAIEGSGSYGRVLALCLVDAGADVVEVPPQMTARARRRQRSRQKSDTSDALLIARVGAREDDLPRPRPGGTVEDLRCLVVYRREQVESLTQEANRLHAALTLLRPGYQHQIRGRITRPVALATVTRLISDDRSIAAGLARRRVAHIRTIRTQIKDLDAQIAPLVTELEGDRFVTIEGIGTLGAAEILAEVGNPATYPTKAKFAMANGTAPLEASSGRVVRHRYNPGGNRQLNRVLHIAALTQISRTGTEGRRYYDRLLAGGKTKTEAIRILKRRISDRIWTHLRDLSTAQTISTAPNLT